MELTSTHVVHAILVSHNGARWLPEVSRAIGALTRTPDTIFAVDTGSQDRSRDLVSGIATTVLVADRDQGFGEALSIAVAALPEPQAGAIEWLWLLHDDFAPAPDALEQLLLAVDDAPAVGIAGPKLRGWNDRSHLLEVGVSIAGNGARWTGLDRRERDQGQHDVTHDVLAVSTAGMLVRRDVWEELGGLDPYISLFRDDVDFGWRANVAGHRVICVPDAMGVHAEAAATERRRIDVRGALHRPHLLDRRHAAYVLLANCSPSRLPWVFLRLVLSSTMRAIGYLAAKLPGYAVDEIGGIALLIARPDQLRRARRIRRHQRLLPARSVRSYLAPFGSQLRAATEGTRNLILGGLEPLLTPTTSLSVTLEDDEDEVPASEEPLIRRIIARPGVALVLGLLTVALLASREKLGPISGGALLPAPEGARDLLSFFIEPWHTIGMGSGVSSPPWIPLVAIGSVLTGGNVPLFITALFVLAVPIAGIIMYALLRPRVHNHVVAAIGALAYALSPVLLAAVHGGRLGTLVSALLVPILLRVIEPLLSYAGLLAASWRRIWVITALLGVILAFTPALWLLVIAALLLWIALHPRERWAYPRVLTPAVGAFLLTMPWSAGAFADPLRIVLEPGLTVPGGTPATLLTLNPGGYGAPPVWIGTALILIALVLLAVGAAWSTEWLYSIGAIFTVVLAMLLAIPSVVQHGSGEPLRLWLGSLLLVATAAIVMMATERSEMLISRLRASSFSLGHIATALLALLSAVSISASAGWFLTSSSPVRTDRSPVLPAFVAELSATADQARTLVVDSGDGRVRFSVMRGRELLLGEPDVITDVPTQLVRTVETLLAGGNQKTVTRLGRYGIGFILMSEPIDQDLARTLDGVGGLQRLSVTDGRILWSVSTVTARVSLIDEEGKITPLRRDSGSLAFTAEQPGVIALAERSDPSWRATAGGRSLEAVDREDGLQAFLLPEPGDVVIASDNPAKRAGIAVSVLTALSLLFMVAPRGRRLRERPDTEVA